MTKQQQLSPDVIERESEDVREWFPRARNFEVIGRSTYRYNCYANAFGIRDQWLSQHGENEILVRSICDQDGWTEQVDLDETMVPGRERIAFYAKDGEWTHGARQLEDGRWESKVGCGPLIIHETLECLTVSGDDDEYGYGEPVVMFTRELP